MYGCQNFVIYRLYVSQTFERGVDWIGDAGKQVHQRDGPGGETKGQLMPAVVRSSLEGNVGECNPVPSSRSGVIFGTGRCPSDTTKKEKKQSGILIVQPQPDQIRYRCQVPPPDQIAKPGRRDRPMMSPARFWSVPVCCWQIFLFFRLALIFCFCFFFFFREERPRAGY